MHDEACTPTVAAHPHCTFNEVRDHTEIMYTNLAHVYIYAYYRTVLCRNAVEDPPKRSRDSGLRERPETPGEGQSGVMLVTNTQTH